MAKEVKAKPKGDKTLDLLLENSIALQKTLADLAADLKTLNQKVSLLLGLFETASKAIKERPTAVKVPATKELIEKVDALAKQNKTIAKGLLLLERAIREKEKAPPSISTSPKPLPEI